MLSACQTALASGARLDVPAGDDWVGLVQSFLQAGAGAVLASLWRVEDGPPPGSWRSFIEGSPRTAHRRPRWPGRSGLLLDRPATAHPFYWAGFVLSGSGTN